MIGSFSGISYSSFAAALAPVAVLGLCVLLALLVLVFREEFLTGVRLEPSATTPRYHKGLLVRSVLAAVAMVMSFFAGAPPAEVAIVGGALLLLTRLKPERIYREIDWSLLLLFAGLFIVVRGMEQSVLGPEVLVMSRHLALDRSAVLATAVTILSNVVSNVPTVLMLKPFIGTLAHPEHAWLILAMASTLAGNLTIVGSVANLIVVERARRQRVLIGFRSYLTVGAPLTLITVAIGILWL